METLARAQRSIGDADVNVSLAFFPFFRYSDHRFLTLYD